MSRIDSVRRLLEDRNVDGMLATSPSHVRWLSGFTGSSALAFIDGDTAGLVTDGRYREQAGAEAAQFEVHIAESDLIGHIGAIGWLLPATTILVQGEHVTFSEMQRLRTVAGDARVHAEDRLLDRLIAAKDSSEIASIRGAQRLTDSVFVNLLEWIGPGMTEREVATEIVCNHLRGGAERMSFEPIVASGPNSALPHARPSDRVLRNGDLVVLDFGCMWDGYASDMTRTIAIGEPSVSAKGVYEIVREAQAQALETARSGMIARDLDRAARAYIEDQGYGECFSHSLGHGVGLEVHEWPRLASSSDYPLPDGVVVSIEPGIYIPDEFGVRIEDLVVLSPDGCENLTAAPKNLIVV